MNALQLPPKFVSSLLPEIDRLAGDYEDITPIWQPSPENAPQCMAYEMAKSGEVMQIGYGGQAYGGKTDLIMGLAGTVFDKSLIMRRTFPQLTDIVLRGDEIYPSRYVAGDKKRWSFGKHMIVLGNFQYERDWQNYQGKSFSLMAFDEAAQFTEFQVRTVGGWQRSAKGEKTLTLFCFNPPTTPEGEWIVQMFAPWIDPKYKGEPAEDGEVRWFVRVDDAEIEVENGDIFEQDGETFYPISRTFIKASRYDNPYLNEDYERMLANMPEPLRSMMMHGDFTVGAKDDIWQVFPTNWVLQAMERGRNTPKPDVKLRAIGCDPSGGGDDETVIPKLYGNWFEIFAYPGVEMVDGPTVGNKVIEHMETNAPIFIDNLGLGRSPWDYLKVLPNINITPIVHSEGTTEVDKNGILGFVNVRSAAYWRFREALDPDSGEDICLPDIRKLRIDLTSTRYKIRGGKIAIELKTDIIKRTGRSPDYSDAVVDTWYGVSLKPMRYSFG